MKVTLDLAKLAREGKITRAEFDKLAALGARDDGALAINLLIGFGVVAVSGGSLALAPTPLTAMAAGGLALALGLGLLLVEQRWLILANISILTGALLLGGGIVIFGEGSVFSLLVVAILFAAGGLLASSSMLVIGATLALSSTIGVRTGYFHATYMLGIEEPGMTVVLFSALALVAFLASRHLSDPYERLAITASRTSVFLVNFGFWIGSLWGDRLAWLREFADPQANESYGGPIVIGREVFSIGWAFALITAGVWAARAGRRWVLNVVAIFAAIHFYTQWFERLKVTPETVIVAGLLVLVFAAWLWRLNRKPVIPQRNSG